MIFRAFPDSATVFELPVSRSRGLLRPRGTRTRRSRPRWRAILPRLSVYASSTLLISGFFLTICSNSPVLPCHRGRLSLLPLPGLDRQHRPQLPEQPLRLLRLHPHHPLLGVAQLVVRLLSCVARLHVLPGDHSLEDLVDALGLGGGALAYGHHGGRRRRALGEQGRRGGGLAGLPALAAAAAVVVVVLKHLNGRHAWKTTRCLRAVKRVLLVFLYLRPDTRRRRSAPSGSSKSSRASLTNSPRTAGARTARRRPSPACASPSCQRPSPTGGPGKTIFC